MTQGVGTACWLSPEVINNAHFSKNSDVYAFGMVLWEVRPLTNALCHTRSHRSVPSDQVFTRQEIYEGLSGNTFHCRSITQCV